MSKRAMWQAHQPSCVACSVYTCTAYIRYSVYSVQLVYAPYLCILPSTQDPLWCRRPSGTVLTQLYSMHRCMLIGTFRLPPNHPVVPSSRDPCPGQRPRGTMISARRRRARTRALHPAARPGFATVTRPGGACHPGHQGRGACPGYTITAMSEVVQSRDPLPTSASTMDCPRGVDPSHDMPPHIPV